MRLSVEIKDDELYQMAYLQCTIKEAAAFYGIRGESLVQRFIKEPRLRRIWDAGKSHGKIQIRTNQFNLSAENANMAMFLGKNYLGQRDKFEIEQEAIAAKNTLAELSTSDLQLLRSLIENGHNATNPNADVDSDVEALPPPATPEAAELATIAEQTIITPDTKATVSNGNGREVEAELLEFEPIGPDD